MIIIAFHNNLRVCCHVYIKNYIVNQESTLTPTHRQTIYDIIVKMNIIQKFTTMLKQ